MKPYTQTHNDNIINRKFTQDIDDSELVWHRDERDRQVTVLQQTDWLFQFDNEIPKVLKDTIFIPRSTYHRLIKGTGDLMIKILEL